MTHSFPTRRSTDLPDRVAARSHRRPRGGPRRGAPRTRALLLRPRAGGGDARPARSGRRERSEEHTSELQSLMSNSYAVFCLTKKKNSNITTHPTPTTPHDERPDISTLNITA